MSSAARKQVRSLARALSEEGFKPGCKILWDAQEVKEAVIAPGDLQRLMKYYSEQIDVSNGHVQEATVVERPLDYSLVELYKELAERRGYGGAVCWRPEKASTTSALKSCPRR